MINFDHNASTPPFAAVIARVAEVMAEGGNPSAVHALGRRAHNHLETARRQVATLVQARARDVTFFGSATEAHATLIRHFDEAEFLRPATEHAAVLAARRGEDLALNSTAALDLEALDQRLRRAQGPVLLAVAAANNETGLLSDLAALAKTVASAKAAGRELHYHIDAVQAPGKLPIDFAAWGCDSLVLSAHKMGGPQGVAALVTRPGFNVKPLILGGGQERRRRAGTENVAGIAGFGLACELCQLRPETLPLRERLEAGLTAQNPAALIVGQGQARLPNTTCLLTPGKAAATLLMQFDLAGLALSSGSACSSGKIGSSPVLVAHGYGAALVGSALRFSLGRDSSAAEVDRAVALYGDLCR